MKLYYFPLTSNNRKVLAVVHHLELAPQMQVVNLLEDEQLRPEFLRLNPNHETPTLEDGDVVLWESNAIMQYLAGMVPGNALWWPAEPRVRCDISRWQCWELAHWHGQACGPLVFENIVKGVLGEGDPDPAVVARAETSLHRFAAVLDGHLKGRQWLVGSGVTLADFAVAAPHRSCTPRTAVSRSQAMARSGAGTIVSRRSTLGRNLRRRPLSSIPRPTEDRLMQYMLLIYNNEANWQNLSPPEREALLDEYVAFTDGIVRNGQFKASDRLAPSASATTVRVRDGKTLTTDGPFAETKEQLGGYYLVEAEDLDSAVAIAARIPSARFGCIEVRPLWQFAHAEA